MEDITPKLLESIIADFQTSYEASSKIQTLLKKVKEKTATYKEAQEYSQEVSRLIGRVYEKNVTSASLPDGRMYYNIASRLIPATLDENYHLVSQYAANVQKSLNEKANIGIKEQVPPINQDRVRGVVEMVSNAESYDDVSGNLPAIFENFCQNVVDESIKENVNFQGKAGLFPKVVRRAERKCCPWCQNLAGEYRYPNVPVDVYRRHDRCRCQVDYDPGTGKIQNVHSKQWKTPEDRAKIEERKHFDAKGTATIAPEKDTAVFDAISSGLVKDSINRDLQKSHCEPPKEGRSYLYGDVESAEVLYRKLSTTGSPIRDTNGNWTHKERVVNDEPLGVYVDRDGNRQETKGAMIVYSKTGSHIYPRKEE